jgi:Family of unknown function (DUF5691)
MIDALVDAALTGTTRQPDPARDTGTPIDALVGDLPALSVERDILLAAGALAVYRNAGRQAAVRCEAPIACPDGPRPALAGHRASVVGDLLHGRPPAAPRTTDNGEPGQLAATEIMALLPEAVELVQLSGQRLPHHLLVPALDIRDHELRAALPPILGERGRWLAQFNKAWRWAADDAAGDDADPETLWAEGTAEQRLAILGQMRLANPDTARSWLAETWNGEKAEFRLQLLDVLAKELSPADEPFLVQALIDRSDKVRGRAATFLHRLPGSELGARLIAVGNACLSYAPLGDKPRGLGRLRGAGRAKGSLEVLLPEQDHVAWGQIGIFERPRDDAAAGKRAWYLARVLSAIAPSHWCVRFEATPEALIAAASETEWAQTLLEAWTEAAIRDADPAWTAALWQWWLAQSQLRDHGMRLPHFLELLFLALPRNTAEAEIVCLLKHDDTGFARVAVDSLGAMPPPWSPALGHGYVKFLKLTMENMPLEGKPADSAWYTALMRSIPIAARCLPPECWGMVPPNWNLLDGLRPQQNFLRMQWSMQLERLSEIIRLRAYIRKALTS